jgi:hypothetical protein
MIVIKQPKTIKKDGEMSSYKLQFFIVCISAVLMNTLAAQEGEYTLSKHFMNDTVSITLKNNIINITELNRMTGDFYDLSGTYFIKDEYGIPFIHVVFSDGTKEKWLMLHNDHVCFLYRSNGTKYFFGVTGSSMRIEFVWPYSDNITASSYLIEGSVSYFPSNAGQSDIGKPWVEGVEGQGIHEKLVFQQAVYNTEAIHISSGFVSFDKPQLYKQNSRPKKINVSVSGKFSYNVELEDTPNYQTIMLPQKLGVDDTLVIEILDVYLGEKYDDTCINSVLFDQMITRYMR